MTKSKQIVYIFPPLESQSPECKHEAFATSVPFNLRGPRQKNHILRGVRSKEKKIPGDSVRKMRKFITFPEGQVNN